MNFRLIFRLLGLILLVISGAICLVGLWAIYRWTVVGVHHEYIAMLALVICGSFGLSIGLGMAYFLRSHAQPPPQLLRRDAMLLVCLAWIVSAALAAVPYWIWAYLEYPADLSPHAFHNYVNCYFESISGLTTAGSTILPDVESLPHSILLWRSLTHWLGGLGIVVLFVAVLSTLGVSGKKLFSLESSIQHPQGVRPHIRDTARILWLVYVALTLTEMVALRIAGLNWFESICETFGSLATGGFSIKNASIAAYHNPAAEWIIIVFMLLGGVNFALYYELVRGRWWRVLQNSELRAFVLLIGITSLLVVLAIGGLNIITTAGQELSPYWGRNLRYGLFNLISLHTDTGYATSNFDLWPTLAKGVVMASALIGGCAGSTTGGIKVYRLIATAKILWSRIINAARPSQVHPIKVGHQTFDLQQQNGILVMVLLSIGSLLVGTVVVMALEPTGSIDLTSAFTANIAVLCTAGPGLGKCGPVGNFGFFTNASKLVMCFQMLIGRLEVLPVLVLLTPRFWWPD